MGPTSGASGRGVRPAASPAGRMGPDPHANRDPTGLGTSGCSGTLHSAMRRLARILLLTLLAALVVLPTAALAVDEAEEDVVTEGETDEPEPELINVGDPAVEVDLQPEAAEDVPAWTYRYLVPTLVALTVVLVAFLVIQYFNQVVKGRQRPVE